MSAAAAAAAADGRGREITDTRTAARILTPPFVCHLMWTAEQGIQWKNTITIISMLANDKNLHPWQKYDILYNDDS